MSPIRRLPRGPLAAAALLPLLALATPAAAQSCLGFPGFRGQPLRLGGSVTTSHVPASVGFTEDASTLGLDLAFGRPAGAFGSVGVALVDLDPIDESATTLGGSLGYQLPVGQGSAAQLCPVATLAYRIGPSYERGPVDVESSGLHATGGVALGVPVPLTPTVRLVPFGALSIAHLRATTEVGTADRTDSESYGLLDLGAGLVIGTRFTVRPAVAIPIGLDGADAGFSLGVGVSFGGR